MPQISFFHKCHSWVHAPHPPFHFSIPWIDIGFLAEEPPAPLQKAPSRPSVTNILVNPANESGQDLVISPWAPSSSGQTPIKKSPDNVVSVECKSPTIDPNLSGQPHPFIYRVQNQVDFSPPSRLPATSLSPPMFQLSRQTNATNRANCTPDPFRKILEAADSNIHQAESILSSLGYDGLGISSQVEDEADPVGLGSDIETNIRRLEKTQAKINAALKTFRNVRNLQSPHPGGVDSSFCNTGGSNGFCNLGEVWPSLCSLGEIFEYSLC